MKSFKLYFRGFGTKQQLIWVGAFLIIICVVLVGIGLWGVLGLKNEALFDDYAATERHIAQIILWVGVGGAVFGSLMLLAGGFAAEENNEAERVNFIVRFSRFIKRLFKK
ncbi:MAG: hypothetical protein AAB465_00585 [Patescibacteria group bacterium]